LNTAAAAVLIPGNKPSKPIILMAVAGHPVLHAKAPASGICRGFIARPISLSSASIPLFGRLPIVAFLTVASMAVREGLATGQTGPLMPIATFGKCVLGAVVNDIEAYVLNSSVLVSATGLAAGEVPFDKCELAKCACGSVEFRLGASEPSYVFRRTCTRCSDWK
jgi:hypothetical protein